MGGGLEARPEALEVGVPWVVSAVAATFGARMGTAVGITVA